MSGSVRNIAVLFMMLFSCIVYGQQLGDPDSLKKVIFLQKEDTNKVKLLYNLSFSYVAGSYADSALVYGQQALELAEKLKYERGAFWSLITLGGSLAVLGNYPLALEYDFKASHWQKKWIVFWKCAMGMGTWRSVTIIWVNMS